jgi:hypothetical protein
MDATHPEKWRQKRDWPWIVVASGLPEATLFPKNTGTSEGKARKRHNARNCFFDACRVDQQRVSPCHQSDKTGNAALYRLLHRH